jgi:ribosomal protein S2
MFHMLGKWRAGSLTTFGKDLKDFNFFNKKSFIYLPKKPDFILLLNTHNADIIINEARLCKIPILGILNASANTDISYFIMKDDVGINTTLLNILWLESLIIKIKSEDSFKL